MLTLLEKALGRCLGHYRVHLHWFVLLDGWAAFLLAAISCCRCCVPALIELMLGLCTLLLVTRWGKVAHACFDRATRAQNTPIVLLVSRWENIHPVNALSLVKPRAIRWCFHRWVAAFSDLSVHLFDSEFTGNSLSVFFSDVRLWLSCHRSPTFLLLVAIRWFINRLSCECRARLWKVLSDANLLAQVLILLLELI